MLQRPVDYSNCQIDPAPFQLVERTSLLKVSKLLKGLVLDMTTVPFWWIVERACEIAERQYLYEWRRAGDKRLFKCGLLFRTQ